LTRLLDEALRCLERGWSICPVYAGQDPLKDKRPHGPALKATGYTDSTGRPVWTPLQEALPSEDIVRVWFGRERDGLGMALITGKTSGVVVLDFDGDEGVKLLGQLGLPAHVRTGSGGYHVRFTHPGSWRVSTLSSKSTQRLPAGLDVRGDGGMAVLPPTWACKGPYTSLRDPGQLLDAGLLSPEVRALVGLTPPVPKVVAPSVPLPQDAERFPAHRILDKALEKLAEGQGRNDTGYWLARALHNNGYRYEEIMHVGGQYVDHTLGTNTKGHREAYTLSEFQASTRQAMKLERQPWVSQEPAAKKRSQSMETTPELLERVWLQLTVQQRGEAARLFSVLAASRQPLERTLTFLRLCGEMDDVVRQAVRQGYREAAAGREGHEQDLRRLLQHSETPKALGGHTPSGPHNPYPKTYPQETP